MRVPADVLRFWERIDARTLKLVSYPQLHGPDFALTLWRMSRDQFRDAQSLALLQIAYTSHQCMSVELDVGDVAGGAIFEWNVVDGNFVRRFNGIAEWLTYIRRLIEMGNGLHRESPHGSYLRVPDPDRWAEELAHDPGTPSHVRRRDRGRTGHPRLAGALAARRRDPSGGPQPARRHQHDRRSAVDALQPAPARDHHGPGRQPGGRGWGDPVRVDDQTGKLDVLCPSGTTLLGPRPGDWYEFDPGRSPAPDLPAPAGSAPGGDAGGRSRRGHRG